MRGLTEAVSLRRGAAAFAFAVDTFVAAPWVVGGADQTLYPAPDVDDGPTGPGQGIDATDVDAMDAGDSQ